MPNLIPILLTYLTLLALIPQSVIADTNAEVATIENSTASLRFVAPYPNDLLSQNISIFPDGKVLSYGAYGLNTDILNRDRIEDIRRRNARSSLGADPRIWLPKYRAWTRIEEPPECFGNRSLHTSTLLSDGNILIAGGFCDQNKLRDDLTPYSPYTKLSILNPTSLRWLPAPDLNLARIYHTATALHDNSVLIVGGEHDPSNVTSSNIVTGSVEVFKDGKIKNAAPLNIARAKHTATLLNDGRLIVVGGRGQDNKPLDSVEIYDPISGRWQIAQKLTTARVMHTATLLADGSLMIAGGVDANGHELDSVEIWNPITSTWQAGQPLLTKIKRHSTILLPNGNVLLLGGTVVGFDSDVNNTLIMLWNKTSGAWQEAGILNTPTYNQAENQAKLFALNNGSALIFMVNEIVQWQPIKQRDVPTWAYRPTLTTLSDGRILSIASVGSDQAPPSAYIWNQKDQTWLHAGDLTQAKSMDSQAILLPSNNVMHIDVNDKNLLVCDIWQAALHTWENCNDNEVIGQISTQPGLGLTDDGRVAIVASSTLAFIYNEKSKQWTKLQAEWYQDHLAFGAPITNNKPLLKAFDPTKNIWLDLSGTAGKLWQNIHSHAEYEITYSDRPAQFVEAVNHPPALLWDEKKHHWTYLFEFGQMGKNPVVLPDGCIFTWSNFKLFNPKTGKITQLTDPSIGLKYSFGDVAILPDGTALFGGVNNSASHIGRGTYYKDIKLSCNGFENEGDDIAMPAIFKEIPKEAAIQPSKHSTQAHLKTVPTQNPITHFLSIYRWNLLAVFGPFIIYLLVRKFAKSTKSKQSEKPVSSNNISARIIIYGLLLMFAWSTISSYIRHREIQAKEGCALDPSACLDKTSGLLQTEVTNEKNIRSEIPCRYVGVWSSRPMDHSHNEMYRITLNDDGTYEMIAPGSSADSKPLYTGYWAVQDGKMVWRHRVHNNGEADINPIETVSNSQFILTEGNGKHTKFELIEAKSSTICSK